MVLGARGGTVLPFAKDDEGQGQGDEESRGDLAHGQQKEDGEKTHQREGVAEQGAVVEVILAVILARAARWRHGALAAGEW